MRDGLPEWVTLVTAPNPGPMTLDGTNSWVLRAPGEEYGIVVDPGPLDEEHLTRLAVRGPFRCILLTHGHLDHVEGAARLAELLGGPPVFAADPAHCAGARPLDPGAELGAAGLAVEVVETPGHTADSVCFLVSYGNDRVMLTGDTILGRGTTVVAKPDGDLGAYLRSLELLAAYADVWMLPGHGPAQRDVAEVAGVYLAHRRERLAQVAAAVAAGADTPAKVVDLVYPDIDPNVRFAAEWSAAAQLEYLAQPGHHFGHTSGESGTPGDGLDRL